jgi:hypothetical protein
VHTLFNPFLTILRNVLALKFIYCRYKSIEGDSVGRLTALHTHKKMSNCLLLIYLMSL